MKKLIIILISTIVLLSLFYNCQSTEILSTGLWTITSSNGTEVESIEENNILHAKVLVKGNELVGENISVIEKLFFGPHTLRIEQDRILETYIVKQENIEVPEDGKVVIEFSIPDITDIEAIEFKNIDETILANWNESQNIIRDTFESALTLLEDVSASKYLIQLQEKYNRLNEAYNKRMSYFQKLHLLSEEEKMLVSLQLQTDIEQEYIELGRLNTIGNLYLTAEQYRLEPDYWEFFSQLASNPVTTDPILINSFAQPILNATADMILKYTEENVRTISRKNGEAIIELPEKANCIDLIFSIDVECNDENGGSDFFIMLRNSYYDIHLKADNYVHIFGKNDIGIFKKRIDVIYQYNKFTNITILLKENIIGLYIDSQPVVLLIDNNTISTDKTISLVMSNYSGEFAIYKYKDIKIWDISRLSLE